MTERLDKQAQLRIPSLWCILLFALLFVGLAHPVLAMSWSEDTRLTDNDAASEFPRVELGFSEALHATNLHLVWQDWDDGSPGVYYARIEHDFSIPVAGQLPDSTSSCWHPDIALDQAGSCAYITWEEWDGTYTGRIMLTKLDEEADKVLDLGGGVVGDKEVSQTSEDTSLPAVCVDAGGTVHLAWEQDVPAPPFGVSVSQIFYARLESAPDSEVYNTTLLERLSNEIPDHYYGAYSPDLVTDVSYTERDTHIVWGDLRTDIYEEELFYTKLSSDGTVSVDDRRLTYDPKVCATPRIERDGSDNLHLVWARFLGEEEGYEVYYAKLDNSGNTVVGPLKMGSGRDPSLCVDHYGDVHVVWSGLYYAKLDNDGSTLIPATHLTGDEWNSRYPDIAVDSQFGSERVHVFWQDNRDGNWELYYKHSLVPELRFTATVLEPDNGLLDSQFDCVVEIESIEDNSSDVSVQVGDLVLVTEWISCGVWEPGALLDEAAFDVAAGASVSCYGRLESGQFESPGHTDTTLHIDLCGSYEYYFRAAPPDTSAAFRVNSEGQVLADSTIYANQFVTGAADVAEWVEVPESVTPGDVVEIDPNCVTAYRPCRTACSSLVAGVVSTEPGVVLGEDGAYGQRALLALTGIVPVKVTNEGGPIQPGDLLVTSSTPGHAMRWAGPEPCSCALVGKALEPMTEDEGLVLVLLTTH